MLGDRLTAVGSSRPTLRAMSAKLLEKAGRPWASVRIREHARGGKPACIRARSEDPLERPIPSHVPQATPPPVISPPWSTQPPAARGPLTVVPIPGPAPGASRPASTFASSSASSYDYPAAPRPSAASALAAPGPQPPPDPYSFSSQTFSSTLSLAPQFGQRDGGASASAPAPASASASASTSASASSDSSAKDVLTRVQTEPFVSASTPRVVTERLDESEWAGAIGGPMEDAILRRALQSTRDVQSGRFKDMNGAPCHIDLNEGARMRALLQPRPASRLASLQHRQADRDSGGLRFVVKRLGRLR